jgi:hypothetical protein
MSCWSFCPSSSSPPESGFSSLFMARVSTPKGRATPFPNSRSLAKGLTYDWSSSSSSSSPFLESLMSGL